MLTAKHAQLLLRAALAALVFAVFVHTRADPDLWGHVRFGQDMVAARQVRVPDTYSFTSDRPWVNHEWLAEIAIYASFAAGGGAGLIALKIALLLVMTATASRAMQRAGVAPTTHDLLIGLLLVGTIPQASHVRPQLFSLAWFALTLAVLVAAQRGRLRFLVVLPPLFVFWVNLHGGWIVGAGTLGMWVAAGTIAPIARREKVLLCVVALVAVLATLANPYGVGMWSFLHDTVGFGRDQIVDWQPVYRLGPAYVVLWAIVGSVAALGLWRAVRSRSLDPRIATVVMMLAFASFRVNRLLGFFAITVVLLLHEPIAEGLLAWRGAARDAEASGHSAVAAGLVASAIFVGSCAATVANATCVHVLASEYPEADVARAFGGQRLHGRMLTWFNWGEYAMWHLSPGVKVSMDGRRETVYSDDEINRHLTFYFAPDRRNEAIAALHPDYIWIPAHLPVVHGLERDGWHVLFVGSRSTLLSRTPWSATAEQPMPVAGRRCFPGP